MRESPFAWFGNDGLWYITIDIPLTTSRVFSPKSLKPSMHSQLKYSISCIIFHSSKSIWCSYPIISKHMLYKNTIGDGGSTALWLLTLLTLLTLTVDTVETVDSYDTVDTVDYWTLLNTIEHYWMLLNTIEHYWTLLNTIEHYWALLITFDHFGTVLITMS